MGWPGPMTHRQHLVWQAWRAEQWNLPDRHDHYLMQLAAVQTEERDVNKFRIVFQQPAPSAQTSKADAQFSALKEQGFSVPRRMTKRDIEEATRHMTSWAGHKPKPRPPDARTRARSRQ